MANVFVLLSRDEKSPECRRRQIPFQISDLKSSRPSENLMVRIDFFNFNKNFAGVFLFQLSSEFLKREACNLVSL